MGLRVVEQLTAIGKTVVVVDDDADDRSVRLIHSWDVKHIVGNAARAEILELAHIATAASLVCVESNELHTLEVALLARELNPGLRVIVRSSNAAVGQAIVSVTGPGTVLDAASLSAPAFVEVALGKTTHEFTLNAEVFRVIQLQAPRDGSVRQLYGDLVPIMVGSQESEPAMCPGRDARVREGDLVALLGTPAQLDDAGLINPKSSAKARASAGVRYRHERPEAGSGSLRDLWDTVFFGADRALKFTLLAVLVLTVIATIVIDIGYVNKSEKHMDLVDSLYTTVQTLVTVGYGDFPFGDQPTYLRLFDIMLMLVGTALIAIMFAQLTDLLISRRIAATLGSQHAAGMRDHVVVVGLGSVGMRVVDQLCGEGKKVAAIDANPNPRNVARARSLNVPIVVGDPTEPETLRAANVIAASAVAVLTSDDLANVETGLAVRGELGDRRESVPTVLRLFDRHLSTTVQKTFGFRHVRSTAALAAPWFVAAALGLDVNSSFTIANQTLMVGRLTVTAAGDLVGLAMFELHANVRVIAIQRLDGDSLEHPMRRHGVLHAGDHVYLIGPHDDVLDILVRNQQFES